MQKKDNHTVESYCWRGASVRFVLRRRRGRQRNDATAAVAAAAAAHLAAHVASKCGLDTEAQAEINANKQYRSARRNNTVVNSTLPATTEHLSV